MAMEVEEVAEITGAKRTKMGPTTATAIIAAAVVAVAAIRLEDPTTHTRLIGTTLAIIGIITIKTKMTCTITTIPKRTVLPILPWW